MSAVDMVFAEIEKEAKMSDPNNANMEQLAARRQDD
jgi:hypothetical protein